MFYRRSGRVETPWTLKKKNSFDFKFHPITSLSDEFEQILSISKAHVFLFINWE